MNKLNVVLIFILITFRLILTHHVTGFSKKTSVTLTHQIPKDYFSQDTINLSFSHFC